VNEGAYVEGSVAAGGARSGALSRIDVPLEDGRPECDGGWYAREGGLSLSSVGKSGSFFVSLKRTFIWRFRGPDDPTSWARGPLTEFGRSSNCLPIDTSLLTAVGGSSTRGPTVAALERSERETNGLVGLVSAALAKRSRAASKASLALARAADRGAGRVGDVLSEPGSRRMVSLCVGVESSS
jgi:hypothetical protein